MIRPNVSSPTGIEIGSPVLVTERPRERPSDEPIAMVRTMPSPNCCWTSRVKPVSVTIRAS